MDVPPLDVFKVWLDRALGNLSQWKLSLLVAGLDGFPVLRRLWLSHTLGRQNFVHKAMLPFPCLASHAGGNSGRRTMHFWSDSRLCVTSSRLHHDHRLSLLTDNLSPLL